MQRGSISSSIANGLPSPESQLHTHTSPRWFALWCTFSKGAPERSSSFYIPKKCTGGRHRRRHRCRRAADTATALPPLLPHCRCRCHAATAAAAKLTERCRRHRRAARRCRAASAALLTLSVTLLPPQTPRCGCRCRGGRRRHAAAALKPPPPPPPPSERKLQSPPHFRLFARHAAAAAAATKNSKRKSNVFLAVEKLIAP